MKIYRIRHSQTVPLNLEECWLFFSNPQNLANITPEYLNFQLEPGYAEERIYAGQMISYRIRPLLNVPIRWLTEITHAEKPNYFIDEQRSGPYALWHHEHRFQASESGVLMTDIVDYALPFGPLGRIAHALRVKTDIERIFSFRKARLEELFGSGRAS